MFSFLHIIMVREEKKSFTIRNLMATDINIYLQDNDRTGLACYGMQPKVFLGGWLN